MRHNYLVAHLKLDPRAAECPEHVRAFVELVLSRLDVVLSGEPVEAAAPQIELIARVGARRQ